MISSIMFSQVAFKIIKLPEDTGNTDIFMASNLNIWNSSDAQFKFNKDLEWNYSLINPGMFWRKKTYSQLSGQNTKSAFQNPSADLQQKNLNLSSIGLSNFPKEYAVIYMQDGQNLFDDYTNFSAES